MYRLYIKRSLDKICALLMILILLPCFLLISLSVLISLGKPIFFSQERIGKNESLFRLYKFRSMTEEKDENGILLGESLRLTKFGTFLRSASLDELPELFSILKGDMSFVGPRPLPAYYLPFFYLRERTRHSMRGGLIPPDGLSGETTPTWEAQFRYDIYYVNHCSFLLDLKIILATLRILYIRFKHHYGAENRPHLNEYRKNELSLIFNSAGVISKNANN